MTGNPNYDKYKLLVPGNGSNGSIVIPDLSVNNSELHIGGSAAISTAQSKFNGSSLYLPTGAYVWYQTGPIVFDHDFTIEFWLYPTTAGDSAYRRFFQTVYSWGNTIIRQSNTNKVQLLIGNNGASSYSTLNCSVGFTANTWQHIAVCKTNRTITVYKDGVAIGSVAHYSSVFLSVHQFDGVALGCYLPSEEGRGYFADVRLIDGHAAYTAAFTPPTTPLVPYAGNLTGNIYESLGITKWDVTATSVVDGKVKGKSTETGTTYSVNTSNLDPCLITVAPKISYRWTKNRPAKVGDIVVAAAPDTTPHLWQCTAINTEAHYSDRSLILHFNGDNNGTALYDSSSYQHKLTAEGELTTISAGATVGNACGSFSGNTSLRVWPRGEEFTFGTGDFSIRFKFTQTGGGTSYGLVDMRQVDTGVYPVIYSNAGVLTYFTANAIRITGPTIVVGTTYDVELSRVSGVTKMFVDGTQVGSSYTDTNAYLKPFYVLIGRLMSSGSYTFTGKIDELIITKGYADHSANFTPDNTEFASGDTGDTEPTWALSGDTTDNNVTWTYLAPLVDPVTIGPKIPTA